MLWVWTPVSPSSQRITPEGTGFDVYPAIVIESWADPDPVEFVAVTVIVVVPIWDWLGSPVITPATGSSESHPGSPVAEKPVGLLLARIV